MKSQHNLFNNFSDDQSSCFVYQLGQTHKTVNIEMF